jgi:hypothetical protein
MWEGDKMGMNEKDFKLIEDNLTSALEYQRNLNQQIMGRLDAYESIVKIMLRALIDIATEKRHGD